MKLCAITNINGGCNFCELGVRDGSDNLCTEQMLRYLDVQNHLCRRKSESLKY